MTQCLLRSMINLICALKWTALLCGESAEGRNIRVQNYSEQFRNYVGIHQNGTSEGWNGDTGRWGNGGKLFRQSEWSGISKQLRFLV